MPAYTRGEFFGLTATAAAALGAGCRPAGATSQDAPAAAAAPDLAVVNANVITMDPGRPAAEAFAVKGGRFVAMGSSADVRALARASVTRVLDAEGATITPGFIDAHSHPSGGGLSALVNVDTNLGSIARIQEALAARAAETPSGQWVRGYMYDDTKLEEGRALTRADLDAVVPDHPVAVRHRGGHTAVYNSRAFGVAGITASTPDPEGGRFYREGGELTGKVAERANYLITRHIPSDVTREERQAGIKKISEMMNAVGLTSVHQTGASPADFTAYQDAHAAGELGFRAYVFPNASTYPTFRDAGIRTGFGDDWVRVGAVKYGADGSASERTMRMSTPYVGRPDDYGILTMTQQEIHEVVEDAHRNGWQVGIHANGDVTIDMVLNAYERMQREIPRTDPRHRIEHCSLVNPELLERIRNVGAIPTPFYTYVHYHGEKWDQYGPEKMRWMFAHRSFLDYGIPVAPASDYTPGPFEPLMAIQSMVTRKDFRGNVWGENQKISVDEALRICTYNGAYASFEEDRKGSIEVGSSRTSCSSPRIRAVPIRRPSRRSRSCGPWWAGRYGSRPERLRASAGSNQSPAGGIGFTTPTLPPHSTTGLMAPEGIHRGLMLVLLALATMAPAAGAAQTTRAEILILGTFHMANPGNDVHNMTADDVLSDQRQREMTELIDVLKRFRPTRIAVEASVGSGQRLAERYAAYRSGTYTLTRNETDQLGLRLAAELDHETVHAVDADGDFPFMRVQNYAIANGRQASFDSLQAATGERVERQGAYLRSHTLLETLVRMNSDSMVAQSVGAYYGFVPFGERWEYAGPDLVADWFRRNIRIHNHIRALATSPDDRILVIYGAGHLGWLRRMVEDDPALRLRTLQDLLDDGG